MTQITTLYRFASPEVLAEAASTGRFVGEAIDHADGFIHLSTRAQLAGTLEKHFAGVDRIALAELDPAPLQALIRWEASRGGDLFAHVYGEIAFSAIRSVHLLRRDGDGAWRLPEELPE